jgi:hypothetical protein
MMQYGLWSNAITTDAVYSLFMYRAYIRVGTAGNTFIIIIIIIIDREGNGRNLFYD